jgi:hypothetical protein
VRPCPTAVEACHEHARLVASVPPLPPSVAPRLRAWHALLDARRALSRRVDELEYGLSDANLRQMPDFETRVEVLQSMAGEGWAQFNSLTPSHFSYFLEQPARLCSLRALRTRSMLVPRACIPCLYPFHLI